MRGILNDLDFSVWASVDSQHDSQSTHWTMHILFQFMRSSADTDLFSNASGFATIFVLVGIPKAAVVMVILLIGGGDCRP